MRRTVALMNLILIVLLVSGGAYALKEPIEPYSSFLNSSWNFLMEHYRHMYPIYLVILVILLYSVFVMFYNVFDNDRRKILDNEKQIKELSDKNTEIIASNERIISEKNELENKYNEIIEQLNNSIPAGKFKEVSDKVCELENELSKNSERLSFLSEEKNKLDLVYNECKSQLDKISGENKSLTGKLRKAEENNEKLIDSEQNLKIELNNLKKELASANANLKGGKNAIPPAAYQILYMLQKEGRLLDMLNEDISDYDDETLGGAFRKLHGDLHGILEDRLIIEPVLNESEGSMITLENIDPESVKISGKVPEKGPYTGELIHRGWRLKECKLPELVDGWKGDVIAPAEIEIE